ncbi:IPT/TIG domain-containing protein [Pontibacter sp. BT731]|uniref:DUF7619 domain-containing protein n=1 Tax=Pontibacter coccineus TaxID=3063328 RepID=UPI0026E33243|nr:IPT/TIG domain-containing protein [Pontibacter sp. BT731]MDO6391282.1 IPT/TIG domain-containing protein [Pontibacter sp. BT731]
MRTALLLFALLFFFQHDSHSQDALIPSYIIGHTLSTPVGVTVAQTGEIYVANSYQVRVLNSEGNFIKDIQTADVPYQGRARAVATDLAGNLYVWDSYSFYLYKYDQEGNLLHKFQNYLINAYTGSAVEGIAVAPDGSIYITDVTKHVVRKFTNEGKFLLELNSLNTPTDVAVGPDGAVYVADTGNKRIVKYSATGQQLASYTTPGNGAPAFGRPTGVEVSSTGIIHVADASNAAVYTFTIDGEFHLNLRLPGVQPNESLGIGIDKEGYIYVSSSGSLTGKPQHGKVFKLWPTGEREAIFGELDPALTGLSVTAMEADSAGHYLYLANSNSRKIEKYNRQGIKLSEIGNGSPEADFGIIQDIATAHDGSLYVLDSMSVKMFSPAGGFISSFEPIPAAVAWSRQRLTAGLDHFLYVLTNGRVAQYNRKGKLLKVTALNGIDSSYPNPVFQDIAVDATGNLYVIIILSQRFPWEAVYEVNKYDAAGQLLFQYQTRGRKIVEINIPQSIEVDKAGNVYVAGNSVEVFDNEGNLREHLPVSADLISVNGAGSTVLAGLLHDSQLLILNRESIPVESYISGTVFQDTNLNSIQDTNEPGIKGIPVRVEPGSVFGFSDAYGRYRVPIEQVGTYKVIQVLPVLGANSFIEQVSPEAGSPHTVTIATKGSSVTGRNFANRVTLSPYLSVSVSSTRRRRCFESSTMLHYSNIGHATAPDAKVYLQLPSEVELLSADKPYTRLPDGTYQFSVGELTAGQSGTITIQDLVTCGNELVRGRTVCTRAWITPSNNKPAEPTPTVSITGRCNAELGMIRFVVRNTGTADMDQHELFRKFANGELASQEQFRLAAGDSLVLWVPSLGYTWRLEADQPTGNGDNTTVSVTIEGCPGEAASSVSTGMINLLPTDDEEAEKSTECMLITDSYDPNDKLVTPVGRTEEFYTPTNTALKYKIRFQNTGTDVAYRIVVVDTLSEHLDLSTLQLGATSHPSRVEVSGKGQPVLTWTFDNIMLPDSTANEPGSHGYIQFSIKPKADLAEKTLVENFADIFFDFNSPIRTNVTQNRIYDMPPVINEAVRVNLEDVLATPGITGFAPADGKFGSEVTITGQRFASKPDGNKVYLNGKAVTVVSASATELKVLVPAGATTGALKVITPDGGVTSSDKFQVYQPPVLTSFSPVEGMVGQTVTLTGEHLQAEMIEGIRLGGLTCEILSSSGSAITVRVPAEATTAQFQINTKGGEALSSATYTVWYAPGISGLSKQTGIVGASITIAGEHFATDKARNQVRFGKALAQVQEASPKQLVVRVPEGAESGLISVETPGGKATTATNFEVIPGPRFATMQPAKGTVGTVVEITGEHFGIMGLGDKITFNGQEALVLEGAENRYKVRVPRGASTGKVTITGFGGQTHSSSDFVIEELMPAEAITVYPNPNNGKFTVSLRHADFDVQLIEVYDALGIRLHQTHITGPRPEAVEISLPAAKAGLYFLQIQTERGMITKKLTVL